MCVGKIRVQVNKQDIRLSVSELVIKVGQLAEETEIDGNFSVTVDLHDGVFGPFVAAQHEESTNNGSRTGTTIVADHFYTTPGFQGFVYKTCTLMEIWVEVRRRIVFHTVAEVRFDISFTVELSVCVHHTVPFPLRHVDDSSHPRILQNVHVFSSESTPH